MKHSFASNINGRRSRNASCQSATHPQALLEKNLKTQKCTSKKQAYTDFPYWRKFFMHVVGAVIAVIAAPSALAQQESPESTLTKEIQEAKQIAQALRASADTVDNEHWIGTMHNEEDAPKHTCYSLGLLLGLENNIRGLRFDRNFRMARTSDDAYELRVKAQSLDNFAYIASALLKVSSQKRTIAWNLDCAKNYGSFLQQKGKKNTFYEVTPDGRGIKILGAIEAGFTEKLRAILVQSPKAEFVALGSGGGSVTEAISAGRLIREKGLTTTIWNNCYSACPLVFLGGVEREISSPYPSLGFHQISTPSGAIPNTSPVYNYVANYIREMGANDKFILAAMMRASPNQIYMIDGKDHKLCKNSVVTWIQRTCSANK